MKVRAGVLSVLLCGAVAGGLVLQRLDQPETPKFCTASLPFRVIDGRTLAVQDKDPDGTRCDLGPTNSDMATLGIDCKVRSPNGTVLDTLTSSRKDGTCGQDSPAR